VLLPLPRPPGVVAHSHLELARIGSLAVTPREWEVGRSDQSRGAAMPRAIKNERAGPTTNTAEVGEPGVGMAGGLRARYRRIFIAFGLAAFVLGATYLVSKPGSGTPAANGAGADPKYAEIERFVQDEMGAQRVPGLALGIVDGDRIAYMRGFGTAGDSGRVTPQTPFIIGSVSKSVTALAVMQLVEAGKIELAAPVQRYLPWFRVADEEASAEITVRNLLNQTSGLSTKTGRSFQGDGDTSDTALEQAVRDLKDVSLTEPVGSKHQYSTINYSVLGLVVQAVSGQSYERYVQTHISTRCRCGTRTRRRPPHCRTGSRPGTTTGSAAREPRTYRTTAA
jgi:CubicO group peptidase (beta-lactamase class C family)